MKTPAKEATKTPTTEEIAPRTVSKNVCESCNNPLSSSDPILLSFKTCATCEAERLRHRVIHIETHALLQLLDTDTLFHILLFAGTGKAGHRAALCLAGTCKALQQLVDTRLWRELCSDESLKPLTAHVFKLDKLSQGIREYQVQASEWRQLHRSITVPIRFRSRSWRSWRLDHRVNAARRQPDPRSTALLHLDANGNPQLAPGFGCPIWTGANHLMSSNGRNLLLYPEEQQGPEQGPSGFYCVLREASSQHLLLAGFLPMLSCFGLHHAGAADDPSVVAVTAAVTAAKAAQRDLPPGQTPSLSNGAEPENSRAPRCLCCAIHLKRSPRHSGAVCMPTKELPAREGLNPGAERPPVMRDASRWFKYDFEAWLPEGGCAPEVLKAAKAANKEQRKAEAEAEGRSPPSGPGRLPSDAPYACLDTALVCPYGHVLLAYELYEREDGETSSEEGDDDEDDSSGNPEDEIESLSEDEEEEFESEDESEDESEGEEEEEEESEWEEENDFDGADEESSSEFDSDDSEEEDAPARRRGGGGSRLGGEWRANSRRSTPTGEGETPPDAAFAY